MLHLALKTWSTWAVNYHEVALREPAVKQHCLHGEQCECVWLTLKSSPLVHHVLLYHAYKEALYLFLT